MKPYYEHGGITIYHGDCREVLPTLADESVDMIWTDPPYGHNNLDGDLAASRVGVRGARQAAPTPIANDSPEEFRKVMDAMLTEAARVLKADCCCCCCCGGGGGPSPTFAWVAERMDREGLAFFHAVIWDKSGRGNWLGWRYRRNYEMVMVAHRVGGKLRWADDALAVPNIVRMAPPRNRLHPNEKPQELSSKFISLHSYPDDLVLDPFMGSGTTLSAAKGLGRRAIGIDTAEAYCEIAARRLSQEVFEFPLVAEPTVATQGGLDI